MAVKGLDFLKSAERWQRYGETYHDEARSYYAELNRTALTIATFRICVCGDVFLSSDCLRLDLKVKKIFTSFTVHSGYSSSYSCSNDLKLISCTYEKSATSLWNYWFVGRQLAHGAVCNQYGQYK